MASNDSDKPVRPPRKAPPRPGGERSGPPIASRSRLSRELAAKKGGGERPVLSKSPSGPPPAPPTPPPTPPAPDDTFELDDDMVEVVEEDVLSEANSPPPEPAASPKASPPKPPPQQAKPAAPAPKATAPRSRRSTFRGKVAGRPTAGTRKAVDEIPDPGGEDPVVRAAMQLVRRCEAELGQRPDPARAARLHYEIARLCEHPLDLDDHAAPHYLEAYKHRPDHLPTVRGARRSLLATGRSADALPLLDAEVKLTASPRRKAALLYAKGRVLEDQLSQLDQARKAYLEAAELDRSNPLILHAIELRDIAAGAYKDLAETRARVADAVAEDPEHRAALLAARAELVEGQFKDLDQAAELYETALQLSPKAPDTLRQLKRLHHTRHRWRDLIGVLRRESELTTDPAVRAMALYRIGRLHLDRLDSRSDAVPALTEAAGVAPDDRLIIAALAQALEADERWEQLVVVLEHLAKLEPGEAEKAALLHRVGDVLEGRLDRADEAAAWYGRALAIDPTFVPALHALGEHFKREESWAELVAMLSAEADAAVDVLRRATAYRRVAQVLEHELGDATRAADYHERALAVDPGHAASFKALVRLYRRMRRYRELVELYERAIDSEALGTTDVERVAYLYSVGALYEDHLEAPESAAHAYRRVLEIAPDELRAVRALQRACENAGRWEELVGAIDEELRLVDDTDRQVALQTRAGEVLDSHLDAIDKAMERFKRALEMAPDYQPALSALARIFHRKGRWEELLEIYEREQEKSGERPDAARRLTKMADIARDRLGDAERALRYLREALARDDKYGPALRSIASLLEDKGRWDDLAEVVELQMKAAGDARERAAQAYRLGALVEERLGDADRAASLYEAALKDAPDHRPSVDALARLRTQEASWARLVTELEEEATTSGDAAVKIGAWMRAGQIWRDFLRNPDRAVTCFEAVLDVHGEYLPALLALEPLYAQLERKEPLVEVLSAQTRLLDGAARVAALHELARAQRAAGRTVDEVLLTYRAIQEASPDDAVALEALEDLALDEKRPHLLAAVDRRLAELEEGELAAETLVRLAESLEATMSPEAQEAFERAMEAAPESLAAAWGLARVAEVAGDAAGLAKALGRMAKLETDGSAAAGMLVRRAGLLAGELKEPEASIEDLSRALELDPDSAEAAEGLSFMLKQNREIARLVDLLSRAAGEAKDKARRAALWLEVGLLQAIDLANVGAAVASLQRILREDARNVPGHKALADVYERDGQAAPAVDHLTRVVQLTTEPEQRLDAHMRIAALCQEKLGNRARAVSSLHAVLEMEPDHKDALARLLEIQGNMGQSEAAIATARKLVDKATDAGERARLIGKVGDLQLAAGQPTAAAETWLEAVAIEGPSGEAASRYLEHLEKHGSWDAYARALGKHIELSERPAAIVYRVLGRVFREELGRGKEALMTLQAGAKAWPEDASLRVDLAAVMRELGQEEEALDQMLIVVRQAPTHVESWRTVASILGQLKRRDEARTALAPLQVLGALNEAEKKELETYPPRPGHARHGAFDRQVLERLGPEPPEARPAVDLLAAMGSAFGKLLPVDTDRWGVSSRDRLGSKSTEPARQLVEGVAGIFGLEDFDVFVHDRPGHLVTMEAGDRATFMVARRALAVPRTVQVFAIARGAALAARGLHPLERLAPREVTVLLAAAARTAVPTFGEGLTSSDYLDQQSKAIHKATSRRDRKELEQSALVYAQSPRIEIEPWIHAVKTTALRAATLLCDDLSVAIDTVAAEEKLDAKGAERIAHSQALQELLRFWFSDMAMQVRRKTGLLSRAL